jgi:mannonate dehydratase
MKITDAKVLVTCPGRNFVTLKIFTDEGIYGLGDATLNGREKSVVSYLEDYVIPCLIGRNPFDIEDIWQYLYRGVYWRRGAITMSAIAAVDMALYDIKGKALNTPVYNLLGGRSRAGVMVYGHANGADLEQTVEEVGKYIGMGYLAIRAQSGIPGLKSTYGVAKEKMYYEPAQNDASGLPAVNEWSTEKYLNFTPKLFKKLRDTYGEEHHFLHDCHHRLTPIEAARLGKELEPYHLFWLEDTVQAELQEGFRLIRKHTTTPLAVGEVFNTIYDYTTLFTEQLIDYVRMSLLRGGGITHGLKVAAMAGVYHIRTGFHGATDLSPVTMAAALHFNTAINNFGVQEYMRHTAETDAVFKPTYHYDKGYMYVSDAPGLGIDYDEALAAQYEYKRAYLPVNRKLDGTMFNW